MQPGPLAPFMDRIRFAAYGLAAGLFIGMFLGWMFHGFVGALVRIVIILIVLIPLFFAVRFWLRINAANKVDRSGIQEAEWWDAHDSR
jgi:hypothetical protein